MLIFFLKTIANKKPPCLYQQDGSHCINRFKKAMLYLYESCTVVLECFYQCNRSAVVGLIG